MVRKDIVRFDGEVVEELPLKLHQWEVRLIHLRVAQLNLPLRYRLLLPLRLRRLLPLYHHQYHRPTSHETVQHRPQ